MEVLENLEKIKSEIFTVSELNYSIKKNLELGFSNIWVEGEVSNCYFHNKKHIYFDLKDEYSKIRVVMFYENNKNLVFEIENGLHLIINGYVSVYEKRGEYQLIALDAKPVGKGSLLLAFEQLKAKLEKKGYFDVSCKQKIPLLPKRIGAVTSTGGAVIHDIVSVLSRRFQNFNLIVRNVNVQGPSSSEEICEAINDLCEYGVDVIIIARGGGSLEDLWAFNTEMVADRIFTCKIPVISAIGHETDFTISDFVADFRAPTPSIAAEIVILSKNDAIENIKQLFQKMHNIISTKFFISRRELSFLINRRIFKKPNTVILNLWQELDNLYIKLKPGLKSIVAGNKKRLLDCQQLLNKRNILGRININRVIVKNFNLRIFSGIKNFLNLKKSETESMLKDLQSSSPVSTLQKGFALIFNEEDKNIKSIKDVEIGQDLKITLYDGLLLSKVLNKINKKLELGIKDGN
jgi:exodeoxyribonuclease VII large subunit